MAKKNAKNKNSGNKALSALAEADAKPKKSDKKIAEALAEVSRALPKFNELERKLNASNLEQLQRIMAYVLADPHFVVLPKKDEKQGKDDKKGKHGKSRELKMLGIPQTMGGKRLRNFFDDLATSGFADGVEIRIQQNPDHATEGGTEFLQVIKIGDKASPENPTLERMEYPAELTANKPDLHVVSNGNREFLKRIFNVASLSNVELFPLVETESQRWKIKYHPDGDPHTKIELACDSVSGTACTGFEWEMFQVELEMKKGDPAVLKREVERLKRKFPFLREETESKSAPGFHAIREAFKNDDMRRAAAEQLTPGTFVIVVPKTPIPV